jgi:hypothetical protein
MPIYVLYLGELIALLLLAGTAKVALVTGPSFVLFPELSALAYNVFTRPTGAWARAPAMLFITPTAAAVLGTAIARSVPYGVAGAALCIAAAIVLVHLLRSPITPAISASYMPFALGFKSWNYPVSIMAVTGVLAIGCIAYQRIFAERIAKLPTHPLPTTDNKRKSMFERHGWLAAFAGFLLLCCAMGEVSGMRLILFPPLVVIAYEMFRHPQTCPWAPRPYALAVASVISAAAGTVAISWIGVGPLSVIVALLAAIATLRILKLNFPPALAISLLPQIVPAASVSLVSAIALGSIMLAVSFIATCAVRRRVENTMAAPAFPDPETLNQD